ncbi:polysaccharide biosynthesis protein [Spirosoma taeanense]|uniref:Polysaccharide biosynthesis protein n=1 Tax=Spirosoma taeanense TaxID=2735870 RepID=A0A6M5Y4S3_9BACT|nr:nucleoside-diphosphate sugar epimerase/dehydratase [Spirosoma taeanense]QJW88191.1 polysaccharide biosynthesis protein [Spirosoma taeanense]
MKHSLSAEVTNRFAPRLVVLLLDLTVTKFAFLFAWTLRFNFTVDLANWHWNHFLGLLLCRFFVFLWIRPFAGIIRHTSVEDALLIGQAVTLSSLLAGLGSYGLKLLFNDPFLYIPASILAIEYFICVVLLIGIRLAIKYLYHLLITSSTNESLSVLIYGAGAMGIHTKDTLLHDRTRKYRILGFIDDNPAKTQKTVQGVRVFSLREASTLFLQGTHKPDVILAIDALPVRRRNEIANFLIQYQVSVKIVPSAQSWIKGRLSTGQIRDVRIEDLLGRPPIQLDNAAVSDIVRGQVTLVTGAAGSIGSELVRQLVLHKPREIVLVDQAESALYDLVFTLRHELGDKLTGTVLSVQIADVTDVERIRRTFDTYRPAFVFHAAAYKHVPLMEDHPYEAVKVNALGTKIVADLAVTFGVSKFIMVSTDKAVNPTNVMGATKRLAEMYVQSLNGTSETAFIATRFGNVLGSSGSVVPIFKRQIEAGGPVTVTHPEVIRYFMTIPEACQLVLEAAVMGRGGEVFVFDMGQPVRIADLARQMIRLSGYEVDKEVVLRFTGLRPGEKLFEELLNTTESTLPTHHPKIKIARLHTPDADWLQQAMFRLKAALRADDNLGLVNILKEFIPEYISNNSPYQALDTPNVSVKPGSTV